MDQIILFIINKIISSKTQKPTFIGFIFFVQLMTYHLEYKDVAFQKTK